jgi:hypothetical protein
LPQVVAVHDDNSDDDRDRGGAGSHPPARRAAAGILSGSALRSISLRGLSLRGLALGLRAASRHLRLGPSPRTGAARVLGAQRSFLESPISRTVPGKTPMMPALDAQPSSCL